MTRRAYTLFEVVLVVAVMVILGALAYPRLDNLYSDFRLTQASDQVRACWAEARAHAMNEGRIYRFAVVTNQGAYRLAPDTAEFWSGANTPPAPAAGDSSTPTYSVEDALPKGVRFAMMDDLPASGQAGGGQAADSGPWTPVAYFLPDGSAREDVEIAFTASRAQPLVVRLRALTGAVTVRTHQASEKR